MMTTKVIELPHLYRPRDYQLNILSALDAGIKRAVWVVHRRGGKDLSIWNWLIKALIEKKQTAFYLLPTYSQAKKIIWEGMTKDGIRFLDFIPKELIEKKSVSELSIRFVNGSYLQLVGSENYDRLVGTNPSICIFSEMALQNPQAWELIKPILAENNGVAVFISTPRGKNHFFDLYEVANKSPGWFCERLTIKDTNAISEDAIAFERDSGMSEDMIEQEFYVSFDMGQLGSYYSKSIKAAYDDDRITKLPYDERYLVYTAWDLGINDSMSIVFFQKIGKAIHIIDHYENQGYALSHYLNVMRERKYSYGMNYFPHDGRNRNLSDGKRLISIANETEFCFEIVPSNISPIEGIEKVRGMFRNFYFDMGKTNYLVKCLENYHADFSQHAQVFLNRPYHDWSSHAADAFRIMAIAIEENNDVTSLSTEEARALEDKYRFRYT